MTFAEMLLFENLILIIFKLLNFGIIIGLIVYGFKKYAAPALKQAWDEYVTQFAQLSNTHDQRMDEHDGIVQQIAQDEAEYARLKERLMRWRASIDEKKMQDETQRAEQIEAAKERIALQQKTITQSQLQAQIMPAALKQARERLAQELHAQEKQQRMFEKIVTHLAKAK